MAAHSDNISFQARFRIRFENKLELGPGKIDLLEEIARTGSITKAARAMGMSYMRAWSLVRSLDRGFKEPLVRKARGGKAHGGADLTRTGREVVRLYRKLEADSAKACQTTQRKLAFLMK